MDRQIVWTPQAQEEYSDIISYLLDTFDDAVAEKFTNRLSSVLSSLQTMPYMGKEHPVMRAIRQVVMRPYTIVCYTILPNQLVIVNRLDSRRSQA